MFQPSPDQEIWEVTRRMRPWIWSVETSFHLSALETGLGAQSQTAAAPRWKVWAELIWASDAAWLLPFGGFSAMFNRPESSGQTQISLLLGRGISQIPSWTCCLHDPTFTSTFFTKKCISCFPPFLLVNDSVWGVSGSFSAHSLFRQRLTSCHK